ncbi:MAG: hypothetical protein AABY22_32530, partial [Nanoarchaeota archaeon]
ADFINGRLSSLAFDDCFVGILHQKDQEKEEALAKQKEELREKIEGFIQVEGVSLSQAKALDEILILLK